MRKERAYYVAASLRAGDLAPVFPDDLDEPSSAITPEALLGRCELLQTRKPRTHKRLSQLPGSGPQRRAIRCRAGGG